MWSRSDQLPRLVTAFFLACGFTMLWAMAGAMMGDTFTGWLSGPDRYEDLLVRADQFVIHSYFSGPGGMIDSSYRLANGRPVPADEVKQWTAGAWPTPTIFAGPPNHNLDYAPHGWDYRLTSIWSSGRETAHWYLIHDDQIEGHAYFVGYDYLTKALVGFVGKDGLVELRPPEDRQFALDMRRIAPSGHYGSAVVTAGYGGHSGFGPQSYEQLHLPALTVYLLSGDELWLADLRRGMARRLGRYPAALDLKLAPLPPGAMDAPEKIEENLMLRTHTEMIKLSLEGEELKRWPIPDEARETLSFEWYDAGDDRAVVRYTRRYPERHREDVLIWIAADGSVVRHETAKLLQRGTGPMEAGFLAAVMPMPTLYTFLFYKFASVSVASGPQQFNNFAQALALYWPGLLVVYVLAALLAGLAYRRQTRYALPGAAAWAVFVFLLGVPGWLAYRWHRRWPVLADCGACHRPAPRDRETCSACGHLFNPPLLVGTEVFA